MNVLSYWFICIVGFIGYSINANSAQSELTNCLQCHPKQYQNWQQSDHAKAMAKVSKKSVLGAFNHTEFTHGQIKATFYQENDNYMIKLEGQSEVEQVYQVEYVFGHYPLQQYLIKQTKGKYQVFPIAWDSRSKAQDGQKWYLVYNSGETFTNSRLHWLQPSQNWNGMCADCHSSDLNRQYNVETDTFQTKMSAVNISCQSCHQLTKHSEITKGSAKTRKNKSISKQVNTHRQNLWLFSPQSPTAKLSSSIKPVLYDTSCVNCHSLRSPLTDGFAPDKKFLDQFSPTLIERGFYHNDGQIKDEVYVAGSFMQSKMYQAGVTCIDCHDPHSGKTKFEGDQLCLQCHKADIFSQKSHHQHQESSLGAKCVNCHMPTNRYMGVDDRRDHSFVIPRPSLTEKFQIPNACNQCHKEQSTQWAKGNIIKWYKREKSLPKNKQQFIEVLSQQQHSLSTLVTLINDNTLAEIYRASSILLLPTVTDQISDNLVRQWVKSELPLIRLAIAKMGFLLSPSEQEKSFVTLLNDKYKAVRVAATENIIATSVTFSAEYASALKEYVDMNLVNAWRAEGRLNLANIDVQQNYLTNAVSTLRKAIEIDNFFAASYINLADIYRLQGDRKAEKEIWQLAVQNIHDSAEVLYSKALFHVRQKQNIKAAEAIEKAIAIEPRQVRYAYIYVLLLERQKQIDKAIDYIKTSITRYQFDSQLLNLGKKLAHENSNSDALLFFHNLLINQPR